MKNLEIKIEKNKIVEEGLQGLFEGTVNAFLAKSKEKLDIMASTLFIVIKDTGKDHKFFFGSSHRGPKQMPILHDKTHGLKMIGFPLEIADDSDDRRALCRTVGKMFAIDFDVKMFMTVASAWGSSQKEKDTPEENYLRPSLDPERFDALLFSAEDLNGNSIDIIFKINKDGSRTNICKDEKIDWISLAEKRKNKKEEKNYAQNTLLESAWMEYKMAKAGV